MRIIKGLAVVGYALVMLLVLTGGRSANEAEFNAGHQACDAQYNMDAMQAFEMDASEPFVQCHVAVNEAYPAAWNNWRRQNARSRGIETAGNRRYSKGGAWC
jgi:hypothetical protein